MANINGLYDPGAEPQQDLGKLPTGEYVAQIVESDVESKESGQFLKAVYEVLEGPMKGRKHWHNFTLQHENEKAQEIGNRQFASLREVTGITKVRDSQELHFKPHIIRVEFYPAGSEYTGGKKKGQKREYDDAEIKAWKKLDAAVAPVLGGGAGNASAPSTGATSQTTTSPSNPPWKRAA